MEIDKTDKKLLYYLAQNARASYSSLAENIGLSREAIKSRIKSLVEKKAILSFRGSFTHPNFGLEFYNFYINFIRLDSEKDKIFGEYLKNHPAVMWKNKTVGRWDYALILLVRSPNDLFEILSDFKEKFKGYIKDFEFDHVLYEYQFRSILPTFFQDEEIKPFRVKKDDSSFYRALENTPTTVEKERKIAKIDIIDIRIMEMLNENCRYTLKEMSERLNMPIENIKYRMKKMVEKKVITAFWIAVNYDLFGLHWYRIRARMNKISAENESKLKAFLANNPNIFWAARVLGRTDLHIDIRVKDNNQLNSFLLEFNSKFDGIVIDYDALIMTQELNHNNFTPKIYELTDGPSK